MKLILRLLVCVLAGAFFGPFIQGSPYQICWNAAQPTTYDYDLYAFEYTPGLGWSNSGSVWGDSSIYSGPSFSVLAADGSMGQTVDLQFTLSFVLTAKCMDVGVYERARGQQDWDSKEANFGGIDSGDLTSTLSMKVVSPRASLSPILLTSHSLDAAGSDLTFTASSTVGVENELWLSLDHPRILPTGLQVIDPTRPAGFGEYVEADVRISEIRVVNVPEGASTLALLLGISLPALAALRFGLRRIAAHA